MKKTFAFAALATLMGAPAFAAAEPALAEVDANADGFVTIEELQANDLDVTAESFADWDVNGDFVLHVRKTRHVRFMPPEPSGCDRRSWLRRGPCRRGKGGLRVCRRHARSRRRY